ncbi:hypothetical protein FFLO_01668 [Filobasidium floriforme]|uniref:MPN domain-containing protein n=1 Tax=Filobasidium floriforme TaxID=5210 RepID=A0A8K0JPD7_9TREE|nr:JAB1/Mov34/MPN/PAD-1 ubiquitin protease-domain-containing protein [Filobasidium floriforme]KAG7562839.1 hypothetical protein FFLO_01668 [Filobasidium floriforme]KAH8086475.1 JAB1/Mov34/MPN/PAD-1 ubiquitin protease-domain-containing protein [Filobasidium floriforme]
MALNAASSALHLNLPSTSGRTPSLVTVHPSVLAQILDHQSRKPAEQPRVIGTLLGVRSSETGSTGSSSEIEIRNCFALPHVETDKEVAVDMEYHRSMMNLLGSGREVLVGWYSSSPDITPYSALIQNFFDGETGSSTPAVHLTFDTNLSQENVDSSLSVKAYVAREVGSAPKPENAVFLPIPCSVKYQLTEKAGLDLLTPNLASADSQSAQTSQPPLQTLSQSIAALTQNLTQIQSYVREVTSGSRQADPEVGRYLLEAVGRWKSENGGAAAGDDEDGAAEEGVKKGLQDTLSVSYLSALIRTQAELSARLNLLA